MASERFYSLCATSPSGSGPRPPCSKPPTDLERSNRDLEQFAYVASHDLQEPLRAVGGYVRLLQHRFPDKLDAKARDYIAGAFDGATRMERLITDLLAFSRVGTRGGNFVPADLERRARPGPAQPAGRHRIRPGHGHPRSVAHLTVDATQMMQLFQNLIGNALKFHGEPPPEIHVGAQRQDGRWVFSVRDNGIGIEPQYFEQIFQIFQRLHTRKDYPGTGIGLAICKKIVERHGGHDLGRVPARPGLDVLLLHSRSRERGRARCPQRAAKGRRIAENRRACEQLVGLTPARSESAPYLCGGEVGRVVPNAPRRAEGLRRTGPAGE